MWGEAERMELQKQEKRRGIHFFIVIFLNFGFLTFFGWVCVVWYIVYMV